MPRPTNTVAASSDSVDQELNSKSHPEVQMTSTKLKGSDQGSFQGKDEANSQQIVYNPEESEDEVVKQLMKDSEPNCLTDFMVHRPLTIVAIALLVVGALGIVVLTQDLFAMTPSTNRDYLIWDDPFTIEYDKKAVAEEYITANSDGSGDKPLQMTQMADWNPLIFYEAKNGGDLLDKENLLKVQQIEAEIAALESWKKVCLATSIEDTTCSPTSIASSLAFLGPGLAQLSSMTQDQIDQTWEAVTGNADAFAMLIPFYERQDLMENNGGKMTFMRSFMSFGLPIEINGRRYKDILDEQEEQHDHIRDFQRELLNFMTKYDTDSDIKVRLVGVDLFSMELMDLVDEDMIWGTLAIMYVLVFFTIKLKSFFLASAGISLIMCTFPITQFINRLIVQNDFYSSLNSLIIFIILGIGADNIFVFNDGWKQSGTMDEIKHDKRRRLAFAVKRSARATATTSGTTSVAFFANFFSPLMPFKSFGLFSSIIIVSNYLVTVLVFPPIALWYEDNLEGKWCFWQKKEKEETQVEAVHHGHHTEEELGSIEKFFAGTWNDMINKFRYPIIVIFLVWTIAAAIFASQLTPLTQAEEFLPSDHELMESQSLLGDNFAGGQYKLNVDIYWGIKDINTDKVTMWDANYIGEAVMDEDFDLTPVAAQQSLLDMCEDLPKQSFVLNKDLRCWTEAFNAYLATEGLAMPIEDPELFKSKLYTWATTESAGRSAKASMQIGFIGEDLRYMKLMSTAVGDPEQPADIKRPTYDAWQNYMTEFRKKSPASMHSVNISGGTWWAFIPSEKAFLSSAFQGMFIAGVFAFCVLLIATHNIIQAFISLVCVAIVIIGVLAVMYFNGWEIGVSESIAMVILIGFSVDYCVHLSADFMHSAHPTREEKMKQAYAEMGVSILSGAVTTIGCGCFLFGGQMATFPKFGVLITSTIILSFLTSMCLFGALMHVLGPEKGFGDVKLPCLSSEKEKSKQ